MELEIITLIQSKFYKIKAEKTDSWQDISHLYCIDDLISDKIVVIDSLFRYIDLIEKKNIKIRENKIYTNIGKRYSDINSNDGIKKIKEYYIKQFKGENAKRKLLTLSVCPTFSCNLACTYCFEKDYCKNNNVMTIGNLKRIERHFSEEIEKIRKEFPDSYINLELFGGEPIQAKNKELIIEFLNFARKKGCGVSIVSNGYELKDFALELIQYRDVIGEICVTLDGVKDYHNKLRVSANKEGSFDRIVSAIDLYLKLGINIRVATNICKDNLGSMGELFDYYRRKGWLNSQYFGVYIGRVFSRTTPDVPENILYESQILEKIYELFPNKTPKWLQLSFIKVAEHVAKHIGLLYNQNEYGKAYYHYCWSTSPILLGYYVDSELNTYRCTTTVANTKYSIGKLDDTTYTSYLDNALFSRNVLTDSKCMQCKIGGFCGGGCVLEREHRKEQSCIYEKNSFDDFINRIFKPRLKELYKGGAENEKLH